MVRLAGIEPTTPWFVAKYSIQLSYSRIKPISVALPEMHSVQPRRGLFQQAARLPPQLAFCENQAHGRDNRRFMAVSLGS